MTELHPLLAERRSTRAFDAGRDLHRDELVALLEAARWSPSAGNSQPWRFGVATRGSAAYDGLFASLAPGNQAWAGNVSALVLAAAITPGPDGTPLPWAHYDTGQAVAHLTVQAQALGLDVHQMGGFDRDAAAAVFDLGVGVEPLVVVAVGLHDAQLTLPEPFASRETASRNREPINELLLTPVVAALPLSA